MWLYNKKQTIPLFKLKSLTATEFFHPDTLSFLMNQKEKDDIICPSLINPKDLVKIYGYPFISKKISKMINIVRNSKKYQSKTIVSALGFNKSHKYKIPYNYFHMLDTNLIKYELSDKCCNLIKGNISQISHIYINIIVLKE